MITDAQLRLSQAQPLAGAAGTTQSTNIIDLGVAGRNVGIGEIMRLIFTADVTFAGGTGLAINLMQSPNPDGSSSSQIGTVTVSSATPAAGSVIGERVVPQNTQRYIFASYVTTGTYTGGAITGQMVHDRDANSYYAAVTGY